MTDASSDALARLETAVERAIGLAGELSTAQVSDSLNRLDVRGVTDVRALIDQIDRVVSSMTSIEVELREGMSLLVVRLGEGTQSVELIDGDLRSFTRTGDSIELERARDQDDVHAFLRNVDGRCRANVSVQVVNAPRESGFHWISSVAELEACLHRNWLSVSSTVASGPRLLIVGDLRASVLITAGCRIQGPEAGLPNAIDLPAQVRSPSRAPDASMFSDPVWTFRDNDVRDSDLVETLHGFTRMAIWHALATSVERATPELTLTFLGARAVTVTVPPKKVPSVGPEIDLFRWTEAEGTSARMEFARQALSLAVIDATDIDTAAAPALGTARSLYQISQQGSISQALAARRAALETTWSASRTAASAARDFASKATERTIVQVGVLAGVLVAEVRDALTPKQAGALLVTLGTVSLATLMISLLAISSSGRALEAELADLWEFRDVLADHDLRHMTETPVTKHAKGDLWRANLIACVTYGLAGLAALAVGVVLVAQAPSAGDKPSPPSPAPSSSHA